MPSISFDSYSLRVKERCERSNCTSIAAAFISAFTKRNAEPMLVIPALLYYLELFSLVDMEALVPRSS
jgi:hypothetical protein